MSSFGQFLSDYRAVIGAVILTSGTLSCYSGFGVSGISKSAARNLLIVLTAAAGGLSMIFGVYTLVNAVTTWEPQIYELVLLCAVSTGSGVWMQSRRAAKEKTLMSSALDHVGSKFKRFWRIKGVFTTRNLVLMAMFTAMSVALAPFEIYIGPQFKLLSLSFLSLSAGSMMLGPWAAILMGLASDTMSYIIRPAGPYFAGYALSAVLANLFYAFWQYDKPLKLWRVICAQLCCVVFVYFGVNMIWQSMLFGSNPAMFFSVIRLVKNSVMFPLNVAEIYVLRDFTCYLEERLTLKRRL